MSVGFPDPIAAKLREHCEREQCSPQEAVRGLVATGFSLFPSEESIRQARFRAFNQARHECIAEVRAALQKIIAKYESELAALEEFLATPDAGPPAQQNFEPDGVSP